MKIYTGESIPVNRKFNPCNNIIIGYEIYSEPAANQQLVLKIVDPALVFIAIVPIPTPR